jgi:UDP-N-acetylglucosamine 2-epimerase (non-hydrolysing)
VRVLTIFGTRPEAIKLAPVIAELRTRRDNGGELGRVATCVTAQHREMLDQVLALFGITPEYDLDIMAPNQHLHQVAAAVFERLSPVLAAEKPDWVLVQGDTTTAALAALAAFYARVRVAHIEAGLRSHDKWQPFPEEVNRKVVSVAADLHFAPTERSRQNLLAEGVSSDAIVVTGNSVIDALQWTAQQPVPASISGLLASLELERGNRLVLVTAHRRENFGAPIEQICAALIKLADRYRGNVRFVYPVHPNPNVRNTVERILRHPAITLLDPLDYLSLVHIMRRSYLVLTDSGGLQEEAPSMGKPVLVLRNTTERPEAVDAGTVRLVGSDCDRIVAEVSALLDDRAVYRKMAEAVNPYGDGQASHRIVSALLGEAVEPFQPPSCTVAATSGD